MAQVDDSLSSSSDGSSSYGDYVRRRSTAPLTGTIIFNNNINSNNGGGSRSLAGLDDGDFVEDGLPALPVVPQPPIIIRRQTTSSHGGGGSSTISSNDQKDSRNEGRPSSQQFPTDVPAAISPKTAQLGRTTLGHNYHSSNGSLSDHQGDSKGVGDGGIRGGGGGGENNSFVFSGHSTTASPNRRQKTNPNKLNSPLPHPRPDDDGQQLEELDEPFYQMDASRAGHSHSPALTHLTMKELTANNCYQIDLVVREVNQRLMDDSKLFTTTTPQVVPNFERRELQIGDELGRGDFGIVYSVESFTIDSCNCPQCVLKSHYNTGLDKVSNSSKGQEITPSKSSSSLRTWLQDAANEFLGNTIPEGDGDHDDDDDDEDEAGVSDDLSTLSGSSLIIRTGDGIDTAKTRHGDFPTVRADTSTYRRCYMQRRAIRQGRPRYAVKHLRDFAIQRNKYDAAIDLAVEATFLKVLKHPNIVRIRGTVDKPGHDGFMIIMDCLNMTLREKMNDEWNIMMDASTKRGGRRSRRKNSSSTSAAVAATLHHSNITLPEPPSRQKGPKGWFQTVVNAFVPPNYENDPFLKEIFVEKLMAIYDLGRALRFLKSKNILFRDLKPENVGFDVRSRVKLFDFGLTKELKHRDLVEPPDSYDLTGMTGSRRYMSPECALCKNYGFSSDVYGYSIIFWEVFSGKIAYEKMNYNEHFQQVVLDGKRPNTKIPGMPKTLIKLMDEMWSPYPSKRPDFNRICEVLRAESRQLSHEHDENGHHHHLSERTKYLMNQSARSQTDSGGGSGPQAEPSSKNR